MKPAHRPRLLFQYCSSCTQRAEEIISDITVMLDKVMTWLYSPAMKVSEHPIEAQMRDRLEHEVGRMRQIEKRMKELASAYNEFLDLREEKARRKQRIERLMALIGPWNWHSDKADYTNHDAQRITGMYANNATEFEEWRAHLPLWEAMREYLSFVSEARIAEMEGFFDHIGFEEGNRQAMESALKRHPSVFKTRRKKREKYLSLKGAYDAPATTDERK